MFAKYYQAELQFLREMGRAYGAAHPESAGMLAERGGDPDVERLLEGFAFLTARLRERSEDAVPEIVIALCELLLPHYLRPVPACSILEFAPVPGTVHARQCIPRGTEVVSVPIDGTKCRFRTTMDVNLLPLGIERLSADRLGTPSPVLRVAFQTYAADAQSIFTEEGLRLHLHGELAATTTLLLWFARHLEKIVVTSSSGARPVELGPETVRLCGLHPTHGLWPWPPFAPEGYRLLQELFALPAKLLFFDLVGLERAAHAVAGERFELAFHFSRPPDLPTRLSRDALRLYCTPIVNLFSASADPIALAPGMHDRLVRLSDPQPTHFEIYSVDQVVGVRTGEAERIDYPPFFDYRHAAGGKRSAYYRLRRSRSLLDDGIDTFLSIATPRDRAPSVAEEVLSIEVTCTNRSLPNRLRTGDISLTSGDSPSLANFSNIDGVTRPQRPPLATELHWRLLSHLALNQRSLADPEVLRSLLALYNFGAEEDVQTGRANRLRVDGIVQVSAAAARHLLEGSPIRGARFVLELDERNYASRGDAFLFAAVIDELIASHATLNSFTELVVKLQPSLAEYAWAPRSGRRPLV